jgi:hypothetical protein
MQKSYFLKFLKQPNGKLKITWFFLISASIAVFYHFFSTAKSFEFQASVIVPKFYVYDPIFSPSHKFDDLGTIDDVLPSINIIDATWDSQRFMAINGYKDISISAVENKLGGEINIVILANDEIKGKEVIDKALLNIINYWDSKLDLVRAPFIQYKNKLKKQITLLEDEIIQTEVLLNNKSQFNLSKNQDLILRKLLFSANENEKNQLVEKKAKLDLLELLIKKLRKAEIIRPASLVDVSKRSPIRSFIIFMTVFTSLIGSAVFINLNSNTKH